MSVVEAAADLFSRGRDVEDHRIMATAEDLYAWAVTLERMATSSPTYHGALGRMFEDHPRYGRIWTIDSYPTERRRTSSASLRSETRSSISLVAFGCARLTMATIIPAEPKRGGHSNESL